MVLYPNGIDSYLTIPPVSGTCCDGVGGGGGDVPDWVNEFFPRYELALISSLQTTDSGIFDRRGAIEIDMTLYPATIGDFARTVIFVADMQKTAGASSVEVQLYDVTHSVQITSLVYSTDTTIVEIESSALTVGSSLGNIRDDVVTMYEASIRMNGGVVSIDAAYCTNARLVIGYA